MLFIRMQILLLASKFASVNLCKYIKKLQMYFLAAQFFANKHIAVVKKKAEFQAI